MLAQLPNISYLCSCKDSSGVATLRKGQTDSPSLLSFVGITYNVGSMNKEQEIWKPVVGFEGYYEVSNLGRVRSLDRVVNCKNGQALKVFGRVRRTQVSSKTGYEIVTLTRNQHAFSRPVHRLVASVFIPNPENKPCVDHINTIRTDNRVENLRWCSHRENCNNPLTLSHVRKGAMKAQETKARRHSKGMRRPIYQFSMDGKLIRKWDSVISASKELNLSRRTLYAVLNGIRHSYGGFQWSFNDSAEVGIYNIPAHGTNKRIALYNTNNEIERIFKNAEEAAKYVGGNAGSIRASCREKRLYKGFDFRYNYDLNNYFDL